MIINKNYVFGFLLFTTNLITAQLRIIPNTGIIFTRNKEIRTDENIEPMQNLPAVYYGIDLNYKVNNTQFSLGANHAALTSGSTYYSNSSDYYGFGVSTSLFQYSFTVHQKLIGVEFIRKYYKHKTGILYSASHPNSKFYFLVFDIYPFVSYCINQGYVNNWRKGEVKDNYLYYNSSADDSRVSTKNLLVNKLGSSLSTGVKLQFRNSGKDILGLTMVYNYGFTNLFSTHFEHKKEASTVFDTSADYISKGSYWGFVFSYPINITKEKPILPKNPHPAHPHRN